MRRVTGTSTAGASATPRGCPLDRREPMTYCASKFVNFYLLQASMSRFTGAAPRSGRNYKTAPPRHIAAVARSTRISSVAFPWTLPGRDVSGLNRPERAAARLPFRVYPRMARPEAGGVGFFRLPPHPTLLLRPLSRTL